MPERSTVPGDGERRLPSVLIVDDEPKIRSAVRQALEREVEAVLEASNGRDAISIAEQMRPGLVIIDLGLPDMEGIDVTRTIREWSSVPILVLSARTGEQEKAALLEAGADDYIAKPFSPVELRARVRAAVRRSQMVPLPGSDAPIVIGDLVIDTARRVVTSAGVDVHLDAHRVGIAARADRERRQARDARAAVQRRVGPGFRRRAALSPRVRGALASQARARFVSSAPDHYGTGRGVSLRASHVSAMNTSPGPVLPVGRVQRWIVAFVVLFALTGAMLLVRADLEKVHVALLFLLVVLLGSAADGSALGLALAGLAFFLFDWFFLPPYNTLGLTNPLDWLVLGSFLVTSVVAAQLLARAQGRTEEARARTLEVERFSTLGAETLNAAEPEQALAAIAEVIRATLGVDSCDIYVHRGDRSDLQLLAHSGAPVPPTSGSPAQAGSLLAWVSDRSEIAIERPDGTMGVGSSTDGTVDASREKGEGGWLLPWGDIADARAIAIPLMVRGRSVGVLRVANEPHVDLAPGQREFLNALSYYAALGVERVQLTADASHTAALRETDRLKNALLASVSHDLRTPLTTVKALAHTIAERGAAPGNANATSIVEEADRLTSLVTDLLDYSRLTGGALQLTPEIESAEDLIGAALAQARGVLGSRPVHVFDDDTKTIFFGRFDLVHSVRAIVNLLENAVKYSAPDTSIEIGVRRDDRDLVISVADRGIGVSPDERERIFEPFHRAAGAQRSAQGAGLGLAISRGLATAQGGNVTYEPRTGGGSVFSLRLPAAAEPQLVGE